MNNPPFAIGQKVVCVDPKTWKDMKRGDVFIVKNLFRCGCDQWGVDIGLENGRQCSCCERSRSGRNHNCFAPIIANYSDATAEILEKFKSPNETPDKTIVPEKVFN